MKKIILLLSLVFMISSTAPASWAENYQDVYICNSKSGKKYHFSQNCRGLNACKAEIKKISIEQAKKLGKTICGWED